MQAVVTTADVDPSDALAYWQDVACARIMKRDYVQPLDRGHFYGHLKTGTLGDLLLVAWSVAPVVSRSRPGDDFVLMIPSPGVLELADREIAFNGTNAILLMDTREPHVARPHAPIEALGVRIPRAVLERRIRVPENGVANQAIAVNGAAALVRSYMREIVRIGPSTLSPEARIQAREHVLDLTALMLGNLVGRVPDLASPSQIAILKVRMAIERQLTDPNLGPHAIAAAAGFSLRHMNRLMAREGTSIRQLLTERRLAKCCEAFDNADMRHLPSGAIARACGFRNVNDFTYAFKKCFHVTPRDYRTQRSRTSNKWTDRQIERTIRLSDQHRDC